MDESSSASNSEFRFFLLGLVGILAFMVVISKAFSNEAVLPLKETRQMDSRDGQPNYMTKPEEAASKVNVLVKTTQGNYTRLAEKEKAWLDSMTGGHGYDMFVGRAKTLLKKPKTKVKKRQHESKRK